MVKTFEQTLRQVGRGARFAREVAFLDHCKTPR